MTATLPAWFQARQQAAKKRYEETPTPKRGDEQWRFANIKQLKFDNLTGEPTKSNPSDLIARSTGLKSPAAKFIFENDHLISAESSLPESVICLPLAEALEKHPDLVEAHFMKQETRLGSAKYAALHEASVTNGLFVHVPEKIEVQSPIEIHHTG